jgi:UDP-N-acetylglucosamine 2-epimerase (non-hydrolysing)
MASFYASVPVAHVEAGLRTHEFQSPFPEEFNRAAVSRLATWHFAPTDRARRNLIAEGIPNDRIWVTGNTGIDSLYMALRMLGLDRYSNSRSSVESVLVTVHRRENFGAPLDRILRAILTLAEEFPKIDFTIPLHPNPQSGEKVKLKLNHRRNIQLVAPMDYFAMVRALVSTDIVITDSGGLQEEAPSLGKPTVVLRESTERPELIDSGMGLLVGSDENLIVSSTRRLIIERGFYESLAQGVSPFGSGTASEQISQVLVESMV